MPTIIDLALLANHSYAPNKPLPFRAINTSSGASSLLSSYNSYDSLNGWYIFDRACRYPGTFSWFDGTKYSMTYIRFSYGVAKEAVFAIPGSHKPFDFIEDFVGWNSDASAKKSDDRLPGVYSQITRDFNHAYTQIKQHFPSALIYLTGHSLGGALSHLLVCRAGFSFPSIGFNPPGVGHIPGVDLKQSHHLVTFNSRYGFVNKIGMQLGRTVLIDVPNEEQQAIALQNSLNKKLQQALLAQAKADKAQDAVDRLRSYIQAEGEASERMSSAGSVNAPFAQMAASGLAEQMQGDARQFALESRQVDILQHKADKLRYDATLKAHIFGHFKPSLVDSSVMPLLMSHEIAATLTTVNEVNGPVYQQHSLPNLITAIRSNQTIASSYALSYLMTKDVVKAA